MTLPLLALLVATPSASKQASVGFGVTQDGSAVAYPSRTAIDNPEFVDSPDGFNTDDVSATLCDIELVVVRDLASESEQRFVSSKSDTDCSGLKRMKDLLPRSGLDAFVKAHPSRRSADPPVRWVLSSWRCIPRAPSLPVATACAPPPLDTPRTATRIRATF